MLGLALDSAGQLASAALWTDGAGGGDNPDRGGAISSFALLGYQALPPEAGKADQLILVVEQLLENSGSSYQDLDVIAVNRGPGSFTGIRSAVALGRGLALATQRPVIGLTTHEAIAANIGPDDVVDPTDRRSRRLMIAEDARRGQVYRQCFDTDLRPLDDLSAEAPDVTAQMLTRGRWQLGGSGASLVRENLDDIVDVTMVDDACLDAKGVAIAANARLVLGETPISGFDLQPLYIRPPDAVRPKPLVSRLRQSVEVGG